MSSSGMSASLKARMQYSPKNKLRTNKDKISICFARDINATFNRRKKKGKQIYSFLYTDACRHIQMLLVFSSPKRGQYINHIKQSYFLTATQTKLKKGNTLLSRSIVHKVIHLTLSLILESLPGNLPCFWKASNMFWIIRGYRDIFVVNLDFHLQKKKTPQCYRNPFGNNIFLSLLSTFQQSLIATVPRSCLHPALKNTGVLMSLQAKGKAAGHLSDILRSKQNRVYSPQYAGATIFLSKFT